MRVAHEHNRVSRRGGVVTCMWQQTTRKLREVARRPPSYSTRESEKETAKKDRMHSW